MYVTVENVGIKYKLAGAVHYSVAGERALFRVWISLCLLNFGFSRFIFHFKLVA